jgi:hypothetical protein
MKTKTMKVFISHSSYDKWVARKLSQEIVELGCTTFLDEKDIKTGQSIDEEVNLHLNNCDDFLILLSPESIKSHWVLIELGGALALRKKVVIVMLHVGANDIPQPISKYLARDINDIDKYYSEVRERLAGRVKTEVKKVSPKKRPIKKPAAPNFKIGDFVKLPSRIPSDIRPEIGWAEGDMDEYLGRVSQITEIDKSENWVKVTEDNGEYMWAFEWLTNAGRH